MKATWITGLVVAGIAAFLMATTTRAEVSQKDLVLYLPFNEGSGKTAADMSASKLQATLEGSAGWGKGKVGGALEVKDVGYALVKDAPPLELGDQFTIEAWVNIDSLPDKYSAILGKADTYMIHLDQEPIRAADTVGIEPFAWPTVEWPPTLTNAFIPLKEWHYVATVFDGTTRSVYIDGKLADSGPHTDPTAQSTNDLAIGYDARGCCNTRKMNALIDEVRIWNRALDADEISQLYSGGLTAVDPKGKAATFWGALKAAN